MAHQAVGRAFEEIIKNVIENSRNDFEEAGYDNRTLEDLKQLWQQKLSNGKLAHYPWDPPSPSPSALPTKPSPSIPDRSLPQSMTSSASTLKAERPSNAPSPAMSYRDTSNGSQNKRIKLESASAPSTDRADVKTELEYYKQDDVKAGYPNFEQHESQLRSLHTNPHARAADLLTQGYGAAAAKPIAALQGKAIVSSGLMLPGGARPPSLNGPNGVAVRAPSQQELTKEQQYNTAVAKQEQIQRRQAALASGTDGAADLGVERPEGWSREDFEGYKGLKMMVREKCRALEAGGPLQPYKARAVLKRETEAQAREDMLARSATGTNARSVKKGPLTGGDMANDPPTGSKRERSDSDVDDDEAINSDLDDPDDLALNSEGEDGEEGGQIMLCTYDKVARVKNKWKCFLKEGIITINGKEYVFAKANGEFEW